MYFLKALKTLLPYKNRRLTDVRDLLPIIKNLCDNKKFLFCHNLAELDLAFGAWHPASQSLPKLLSTGKATLFELEMIVLTLKTALTNQKMLAQKVGEEELAYYKEVLPSLSAAYQVASSRLAFIREHKRLQEDTDVLLRQITLSKLAAVAAGLSALTALAVVYLAFALTL